MLNEELNPVLRQTDVSSRFLFTPENLLDKLGCQYWHDVIVKNPDAVNEY